MDDRSSDRAGGGARPTYAAATPEPPALLPLVARLRRSATSAAPAAATAVAVLLTAVAVDGIARRVGRVPVARLGDTSMTFAALWSQMALVVVLAVIAVPTAAVLVHRFRRPSPLLAWSALDDGNRLRLVAGIAVMLLTWRYTTTGFDYVFGQWHTVDRVVLVLVAAFALARPIGLLPFLVMVRVIWAPFLVPLRFFSGQNIDRLLVLVIAMIAAGYLVTIITGDRSTSKPVVVLLIALVAAQFFVPGRAKLAIDWFTVNDLGNMPLNGYAQGWLGAGTGEFARTLADLFDTLGPFLRPLMFVLEVGAPLAVLHRRLAAGWLVGFAVFHVAVGAALGFSFAEWIVIELALVVLLLRRANRDWMVAAFRAPTVVVAAAAVIAGGWLFRPPPLAWLDGPLVYAYEIDGVDESGRTWALDAADLAPYDPAFAFGAVPLGPSTPLAAGYGAIDAGERDRLRAVTSMQELGALEAAQPNPVPSEEQRKEALWVLEQFLQSTGSRHESRLPAPPRHFFTERTGGDYTARTRLVRLEVTRRTVLRTASATLERREPVVTIEQRDGRIVTTTPSPSSTS